MLKSISHLSVNLVLELCMDVNSVAILERILKLPRTPDIPGLLVAGVMNVRRRSMTLVPFGNATMICDTRP